MPRPAPLPCLRRPALRLLALCCAITAAHAGPKPAPAPADTAQVLACLDTAAARHGVDATLLRAVAMQESGLQPQAWRVNTDGSQDLGLMQVNSRWLPVLSQHGITREHLMQPCVSADVGAWILAQSLRRQGNTWQALAAYHSSTPAHNQRYAWAVYRRLQAMKSSSAMRPS